MLAWPYGYQRVMSSYNSTQHNQGPPNSGAAHGYAVITDNQRIAFARLRRGFFALNGSNEVWRKIFSTMMPPGDYCDQYAGSLVKGKCTGETITVNGDGSVTSSVIKPHGHYQKTLVFIKRDTYQGQNLFIRGGTSNANHDVCSAGLHQQSSDKCAIPIIHNTTVPFVYAEYLSWSQNDQFLDFEGAEKKQGTHNGKVALGTPLVYTSNKSTDVEYQPYNKYGSGYWMVQLLVDCSKTDQGWFELKGYAVPNVGWEQDINQQGCSGDIGGAAPFRSVNHIAKCGAVNVFTWDAGDCIIDFV
uniref:Aamy_C domain-containing protein n=1 Tax=Angiostrongylus cantonensis TaxID=6313 RepID=A0A0K0DEY8_ANGCA